MALDRLKSVTSHLSGTTPSPHPFDPLSNAEIESAVQIIRTAHGKLHYNAVTLREPKKAEMLKWLESPTTIPRPARVADIVAIAPGGGVYDGLVDLKEGKITKWEKLSGVQPLVSIFELNDMNWVEVDEMQITMEDLQIVEHVVRKDPKVIEQCVLSGIPAEDMHKVYCDRTSDLIH
jgi:primary-amine oxidase